VLGALSFIRMIDDLIADCDIWKFMDDTTLSVIVQIIEESRMQVISNEVQKWSQNNRLNINADKTKEMVISFKKKKLKFNTLYIDDCPIEQVNSIKVLGLHITDNLKWNLHVSKLVANANKKLYFLKHLKRAGLSCEDLIIFYKSVIRSTLEYACQVWHGALSTKLTQDLERVQKRALQIIYPGVDYKNSLAASQLDTLHDRREYLCKKLFKDISENENHKLHSLVNRNTTNSINLRKKKNFCLPQTISNRFKNSYINYCLFRYQ